MSDKCVIVRGGGDLASGVIHRLHRCGYRVLILECEKPSAIRRKVAFCEAVYDGTAVVEGVLCRRADSLEESEKIWQAGELPLMVDPTGKCIAELSVKGRVSALVDAILAKRNLGTSRDMAPLTIGLGPGFSAGEDVDYVVETMRGHDLARIITKGPAIPNTGVPGMVGGVSKERVIHSPGAGRIHNIAHIADLVEKGQILAYVGETPVEASITGVLRGIIKEGYNVPLGMKIADIDPRKEEKKNCFTISDKARCIAGSVVEILLSEGVLPEK
ncbi:selenium-dependent molybdenum cofactor biosynthesis protein YqeB [Blautia sp. Sow4_E7]|uniref:selenium-dependent molybdenum cofactor biosynthesis protein YqeB n=1 Tax=Blautia sp. Sow4_E7 TaxID=3438749 RepID=UPI003F9344A8